MFEFKYQPEVAQCSLGADTVLTSGDSNELALAMSFWNTWRKQWVGGHMLFLGGESWTSDLRPFLLLIPHKTHGTMEMAMVHRPPPSFIHERPPSRAGAAAATQSNRSHWRTQGTNWVAARRWDEWQPFCVHLQGILAVYQYQVKYWNTIWVSIIGFVNVNERSWTSLHHCLVSSAHLSKISVVLAAHSFSQLFPFFPTSFVPAIIICYAKCAQHLLAHQS